MTSNNLPLNFFVNLDLFVSRIAIANQISQQFALYKLLLLLVLADHDNDAVTIDCSWSPYLDSQHHPAVYWAK